MYYYDEHKYERFNRERRSKGRGNFPLGFIYGVLFSVVVFTTLWRFDLGPFSEGTRSEKIVEKTEVVGKCIEEYYQGEINEEDLVDGATKGMVAGLGDKYSVYYSQKEYEEMMKDIEGSYVGIGVTLKQEDENTIRVTQLNQNGPAAKAGIQEGDRFLKLDGEDITGMALDELVAQIKSDANEGRKFTITVERRKEDGTTEVLDKKVVCEKVTVESIEVKQFGNIGYIRIIGFDKGTDEQFQVAMENMRNKSVDGIVFDVRDNGGGSLDTVVAMLDELLPEGLLLTEKSKKEGDEEFRSTDKVSYDKPMVVLMNGNSASASEIFAGALQTRGAAKLIGTKSYGKGVVQSVLSLENSCGGGLRLTTAEYFLPNGESIHEKGLMPDVEIEYEKQKGEYKAENDNQLAKALEVMNQ
nr:S41 family peptidase [Eubacterium sp.]